LPNIKSAKKRVKVIEKKNLRNRMIKSAMRTTVKKYEAAVAEGTANEESLAVTMRSIDKAASKGSSTRMQQTAKRHGWPSA